MRDAETWMEFRLQQSKETPAFAPQVTVGVEALARVRDSVHRPWVPESVYVFVQVCIYLYIQSSLESSGYLPAACRAWVKLVTHTTQRERVEADQETCRAHCFVSFQCRIFMHAENRLLYTTMLI